MYDYDRNKFDWETREDAETIKRYKELESNPERMRRAKSCIQDSIDSGKRALGIKIAPPQPGRSNPATIMKLKTKF